MKNVFLTLIFGVLFVCAFASCGKNDPMFGVTVEAEASTGNSSSGTVSGSTAATVIITTTASEDVTCGYVVTAQVVFGNPQYCWAANGMDKTVTGITGYGDTFVCWFSDASAYANISSWLNYSNPIIGTISLGDMINGKPKLVGLTSPY